MLPDPEIPLTDDAAGAAVGLAVNGEAVRSAAPTLHALLVERGLDPGAGGFACAVNGAFVPRAQWAAHALRGGDRIDIVAPVTGG